MAARLVSVTTTDTTVEFVFGDNARLDDFLALSGQRYVLGLGYFLANKADREAIVATMGAGRVRRGLLVLAKSRGVLKDDDRKAAAALAESLRTLEVNAA